MAGSRGEAHYLVTRRCIAFCCAGVQRIELCRRGFWRPSGYLSLTPPVYFRPVPTCGFEGLPGSDWVAFTGLLIDPEGDYIGTLAPVWTRPRRHTRRGKPSELLVVQSACHKATVYDQTVTAARTFRVAIIAVMTRLKLVDQSAATSSPYPCAGSLCAGGWLRHVRHVA